MTGYLCYRINPLRGFKPVQSQQQLQFPLPSGGDTSSAALELSATDSPLFTPKHGDRRRKQWRDSWHKVSSAFTKEEREKRRIAKAAYDKKYRKKHRKARAEYKADPRRKRKWNAMNRAKYRAAHPAPVRFSEEEKLRRRREADAKRTGTPYRRDSSRVRNKRRRKADINYRITINLRSRLRNALLNGVKAGRTLELIGCTIEQLRHHLESKFQTGMSWTNYGVRGWHIDHQRPLASFNISNPDEQKVAFHYTNLQPLWAVENIRKNSRLPDGTYCRRKFASVVPAQC